MLPKKWCALKDLKLKKLLMLKLTKLDYMILISMILLLCYICLPGTKKNYAIKC